ncbi:MAG TPA: hypothetical protein VE988_24540 [Gemmataceae bacterium]|nr:hypothetical protein [Gemmataceae bacterium]
MTCPPAIAGVLVQILNIGLLRIRAAGWENQAEACAREADHLHNLPSLLTDFSEDRLLYYWEAERTSFIEQSANARIGQFADLWSELEKLLPAKSKVTA